jgi:hypothetical protein
VTTIQSRARTRKGSPVFGMNRVEVDAFLLLLPLHSVRSYLPPVWLKRKEHKRESCWRERDIERVEHEESSLSALLLLSIRPLLGRTA